MKKNRLFTCALFFCIPAFFHPLFAQQGTLPSSAFISSGTLNAQPLTTITLIDETDPFSLNIVNDCIQLAGGFSLSGSALLCGKVFHIKTSDFSSWDLEQNYNRISYLEQCLMTSYSKPLDYVGTGFAALSLAAPAVMLTTSSDKWLKIGVMYAESLLWAYGIKEWGKLLVHRARPYMYFDGYPQAKVDDGDWDCSFPSGHTTLAFTGAAFTSYLFNQYFPDSPWRFAVTGISFGLAATTGAMRIASGNHFLSDVLTGALIGTTCGLLVPFMHTTDFYKKFQKKGKVQVAVSPAGFNAVIKLD